MIDSHVHAWRQWPYDQAVPDPATRGCIDHLLYEMDRHEVERALVVCARIGGNDDNNEYVARAAARLTLISRGFDIRGLVGVERGHLAREPEYVGSAGAYATGTPDGVRSWLRHYAAAVSAGADEIEEIGNEVLAPSDN